MKLRDLLTHLPKPLVSGSLDTEVDSVTSDSRKATHDTAFIAIRGNRVDGHDFIESAIKQGASVIVAEAAPTEEQSSLPVAWVHVKNTRLAYAYFCSALYENPSHALGLIGVTGTNGKSTTGFLAQHIMRETLRRAGLIGTVILDDGESRKSAELTTPDAHQLQEILARMVDNGCKAAAMEVSSIGVDQQRIAGTHFAAGVFTNFTQDHLDYHKSMEAYYEAKAQFFEQLANQEGKRKPAAIINVDDPKGRELVKRFKDRLYVQTYGMALAADFKATAIKPTPRGTEFQLDYKGKSYLVRMPLIGRFNVYNALAAIASVASLGVKVRDCVQAMTEAPQVPGRVEMVGHIDGTTVFVDYAHTPDALETVCSMLKDLEPYRLITVFGCGGDRDTSKRPIMGKVASSVSDVCFITSDNPRSEDPQKIIDEIKAGAVGENVFSVPDRSEAIDAAIKIARGGDIVLVAGKGHENYQELATGKIDFDDRKIVRMIMGQESRDRFFQREEKKKEQEERKANFERDREDGDRGERSREDKPRFDRPRGKDEWKRGESSKDFRDSQGSRNFQDGSRRGDPRKSRDPRSGKEGKDRE